VEGVVSKDMENVGE